MPWQGDKGLPEVAGRGLPEQAEKTGSQDFGKKEADGRSQLKGRLVNFFEIQLLMGLA